MTKKASLISFTYIYVRSMYITMYVLYIHMILHMYPYVCTLLHHDFFMSFFVCTSTFLSERAVVVLGVRVTYMGVRHGKISYGYLRNDASSVSVSSCLTRLPLPSPKNKSFMHVTDI